jgi:hypothetical protein
MIFSPPKVPKDIDCARTLRENIVDYQVTNPLPDSFLRDNDILLFESSKTSACLSQQPERHEGQKNAAYSCQLHLE